MTTMTETRDELNELFSIPGQSSLPPDIHGELQSTQRVHQISAQELFYKWESYSIKMGSEETKLDLNTARAFRKDILETLEREKRGRTNMKSADKRGVHATPRANVGNGDAFGMLDDLTPNARRLPATNGNAKRKAPYETPAASKVSKSATKSSPTDGRTAVQEANGVLSVSFANRQNAGQIVETLNDHLSPAEPPIAPPAEPRIKLTANTDLKKFFYKPMAMHLSECSEVLDDRIDEFLTLVQSAHNLEDSAFGNPASKSTSEIIAIGRIASDTAEGKLNLDSLVLETSRRTGAGLRVPLNVSAIPSAEFFPGQIVAVRGVNASGAYFSARETLSVPLLPPAASLPSTLDTIAERLGAPSDSPAAALNILVSAGPYTADDNLAFEPLHSLCEKAATDSADALILIGPFLNTEHPLLAAGDFTLPDDPSVKPDTATLTDAFRVLIGAPLRRLAAQVPSITIILVPSTRDAVNKHVSWPQAPFVKKELGLPKQARTVSNPVTISLNEVVVGICAQDVLFDLRKEEVCVGKPREGNLLSRLAGHVLAQRCFYPLFPPGKGLCLDTGYAILGDWVGVRPDVLVLPGSLMPFSKVVDSVLVLNPGPLSKRKAAGTFAQLGIHPRTVSESERAAGDVMVGHRVFERVRVDVVRI